ncbi:MAG: tRNA-guanine transglycosylase [Candidatus Thermoplasmatota archaeon]
MLETINRAKKSVKVKDEMNLACPIQGSTYPDLRKKCALKMSEINADFHPIGGVVPLMENQRYTDLLKIIIASKKGLVPDRPAHLFGAGHPLIFPIAVALGCDFFDSSAYVKYANDKRMIFPWGTEKIDELEESPCFCPICSKYSISELKKLEKKKRIQKISKHNLYVCQSEIFRIRNAIKNGSLWELVERKARYNPYLQKALLLLRKKNNKKWMEKFEPITKKKAVFYTGSQTIHRPIIYRSHKRLDERYNKKDFDVFYIIEKKTKPYSTFYRKDLKKLFEEKNEKFDVIAKSNMGAIPIELDEMYPFAQSIFPEEVDVETRNLAEKNFSEFLEDKQTKKLEINKSSEQDKKIVDIELFDQRKVAAVIDMQFGKNVSTALLDGQVSFIKSKNTGKIRNVLLDGKHILSMRAEDGFFTLKIEGGKLIKKSFKKPFLRVTVDDEAKPFVKDGKSVFAKFVLDCDENLRPYDECLLVDKKDNLLAVGRCLLNREEMLSFNNGVAAKNREHI